MEIDENEWFDLDQAIDALLAQFTAEHRVWEQVHARCKAGVFCGLFMSADNQMGEISAATMKALGERGLGLTFDIYGP